MKVVRIVVVAALMISASAASGQVRQRAEDSKLEMQIRARLRADPDLKRDDVRVRVRNGVAMLWGTVQSQSEHAKAEELAHVEGVARIDDQLEGGRSHGSLQAVSDAAISMKLKTQYMADSSLKHEHVVVTTTDGVVTLSGSVPSGRVRRRVIQIADSTEGVKRVIAKLDVVAPR